MNNDEKNHNAHAKKPFRKMYILAAVCFTILLIRFFVIVNSNWVTNSDTASDAVIRQQVAFQLDKAPNELTTEDFAKITKLDFLVRPDNSVLGSLRAYRISDLSDIRLLKKFTNLQELDLSFIKYPQKNIPKWAKVLAKTGIIDLDERFAIDLSPIKNLSALKTLRLSYAQISDIKPLKNLPNLETLFIDNTHVSDLEPLRGLTNLQTLSISETPVSSLEPIKQLRKLQRLIMINCPNITDEQLKDLKTACPDLIVINKLRKNE